MTLLPPVSDPTANCGNPTRTARFDTAGLTVTVNVVLAVCPPASATVTVTVAVPVCPGAGVTLTVRFAPDPPRVMLPAGNSVVLLDTAVTVSAPGVSASPTVKAIGPMVAPAEDVWFATAEMVGGVFGAGATASESVAELFAGVASATSEV